MAAVEMLALLIGAHALCDYPLQGPFLSEAKSRVRPIAGFPWWHAMGSHAAIHGLAVGLITGVWWLGLCEAAVHFVIDDQKCQGRIGINADQAAHIGCKLLWLVIALHLT